MSKISNPKFTCIPVTLLALVVLIAGCGPNDGRIEISGTVLCDGEPLPQANLAFIGNGGGAFATCSTDKEGKFTVRAHPGLNKVSVAAIDTSGAAEWAEMEEEEQLTGTMEEMREAEKNMPKPLVAQKYFNADTSGITVDVTEGLEDVSIEVTKEDGA